MEREGEKRRSGGTNEKRETEQAYCSDDCLFRLAPSRTLTTRSRSTNQNTVTAELAICTPLSGSIATASDYNVNGEDEDEEVADVVISLIEGRAKAFAQRSRRTVTGCWLFQLAGFEPCSSKYRVRGR